MERNRWGKTAVRRTMCRESKIGRSISFNVRMYIRRAKDQGKIKKENRQLVDNIALHEQ